MRRQYLWTLLVIVVVAILRLRSGGAVPYPTAYQTLGSGQVRIAVKLENVPNTSQGEDWNLQRYGKGEYTVNMFLNGRESRTFATRSVQKNGANGTLYTSAGKIKFETKSYHAIDIFVAKDGKTGYIDFALD